MLKFAFRFTLVAVLGLLSFVLSPAQAEDAAPETVLVMLGDSITAGRGLPEEEALPVKLEEWLQARGHDIVIRNAGISGDTSAGGRERVDWSIADDVDAVLVALGGNDILRAIPPSETRKNIESILQQIKARDIQPLLAGMMALPNYGPEYGAEFTGLYTDLAEAYEVPLYPFLIDGVAASKELNQPDGIHPNEAGVAVIVERLGPFLEQNLFPTDEDLAIVSE